MPSLTDTRVAEGKEREDELRKLTPERTVIPEKVRERSGLYVLELLGYRTWRLGKPVPVTCRNPQCRTFQWAQATGNTTGIPDCVVGHRTRWKGFVLFLETKRAGGAKRDEQAELVDEGFSAFVTTEEDFVRAVIAAEERLGLPANPNLINWLVVNRRQI